MRTLISRFTAEEEEQELEAHKSGGILVSILAGECLVHTSGNQLDTTGQHVSHKGRTVTIKCLHYRNNFRLQFIRLIGAVEFNVGVVGVEHDSDAMLVLELDLESRELNGGVGEVGELHELNKIISARNSGIQAMTGTGGVLIGGDGRHGTSNHGITAIGDDVNGDASGNEEIEGTMASRVGLNLHSGDLGSLSKRTIHVKVESGFLGGLGEHGNGQGLGIIGSSNGRGSNDRRHCGETEERKNGRDFEHRTTEEFKTGGGDEELGKSVAQYL